MSLRLVCSALIVASGMFAMASYVTPAGAAFRSGTAVGAYGAIATDTKELEGIGACDQSLYQRCASASGRNQRVDQNLAASCLRCFPGIGFEVLSNQIGLGPFMQYGGQYYAPVCP
jgi:hypothetical protein